MIFMIFLVDEYNKNTGEKLATFKINEKIKQLLQSWMNLQNVFTNWCLTLAIRLVP